MFARTLLAAALGVGSFLHAVDAQSLSTDNPLALPPVGAHELRVLAPDCLELTLVTTKKSPTAPVEQWNFVDANGGPRLPKPAEFVVLVDGKTNAVKAVGFRRRVLYAPLKQRDLRIGNSLFLQLTSAIADGQKVEVRNPGAKLWSAQTSFTAQNDPSRWSPAIHVNESGYQTDGPKTAMVGYYLGSLGELSFTADTNQLSFRVIDASSNKEVLRGPLVSRPDRGFPFTCYQRVWEADFSSFKQPGEYRLAVPGLGASFPFFIDDGAAAMLARTFALGIYHQRCGMADELPFTRFTHGPCHIAPAEVPTMSDRFENVNYVLKQETENAKENPRHTAPPLKDVAASLYPFVNRGPVDVRGGHHDAGDYSKYTANSAAFIHFLVFAADNFPGAVELDNLGLPESGDGKSDLLQEAKWEADFLAKLQDADGGFYFLVYPRDRRYEDNVTPDHGDPQVVFPKTTSVTAAAVAALAQCASSPSFRKQFPEAAELYLKKARLGWKFLEQAIAKHGKDGAYQKITHYSDDAMHDDELVWAACELFLATGEPAFQEKFIAWFDPADPSTRRWGWWRLFDAYGNAIRDYAFGARSGRVKRDQLNALTLTGCENELVAAGEDQLRRAEGSAYGTSFPLETKRTRSAGWYFCTDAAFDLAVASQLDYPEMNDPRPKMLAALWSNLNYESGCNPVNVVYLTGAGWKRQREIVHQYAQNDRRVLPPTGIPLGEIQGGFGWLDLYGKELGQLSFPTDDDPLAPYPFYDRWGDSFNLNQEFVISNQARGLAALAWLMARSPLKTQRWKSASAEIRGPNGAAAGKQLTFELSAADLDLSKARIVWEARDQEPAIGPQFHFIPAGAGAYWVEAEAQLPDGRRVFAAKDFNVSR